MMLRLRCDGRMRQRNCASCCDERERLRSRCRDTTCIESALSRGRSQRMSDRYDLAVIGGGPAGTAAAITAARRGKRVALLERGRYPRHKVCGEFVSAESLELLEALLGQ